MTVLAVLTLASALTVSTLFLVTVVAVVWWLDRYDREPMPLVLAVFVWGATVAPALALAVNGLLVGAVGALPPSAAATARLVFLAPALEETLKAVAVILVVLFSRDFDNPTDGVVYGTAVGLGFAVTENVVYAVAGSMSGMSGVVLGVVAGRTVLSAGIHALASACFGGFLGVAHLAQSRVARIGWTVFGLVAATVLHAGWNAALLRFTSDLGALELQPWLVALPLLYGLYVLTLGLFLRSEHRILKRQLELEVELEVLPAWVIDVIPYYRRRLRSDWWPRRSERTVLSRLLTRLAFRKHAIEKLPEDEAQLAGLEVVHLRKRIRQMIAPEAAAGN